MGVITQSYTQNLKKNLWNFIVSRLFPFFGISIAAALLAHKNINDLPLFAYVLAIYSVVSTVFSMPLAAIGNIFHYKKNKLSPQVIFEDGFKIALIFAICAFFVAGLVLFLLSGPGFKNIDEGKFYSLSIIYIPAIPLLVINTYLHIFHESTDGSYFCARIKRCCILIGCATLVLAFFITKSESFLYFAVGYFSLVEMLILGFLIKLSKRQGYFFVIKKQTKIFHDVVSLGFPIAAGLAGQKIYYYLLNEKLLSIDSSLAGDLSICMSVIGCLTIPLIAFSQMHSVYTSKNISVENNIYRKGLFSCTVLVLLISVFLCLAGKPLFYIFGDSSLEFSWIAFLVIVFSITSSGYFMLTTSHLRAMSDTLTPQVVINFVMLAILIPVIYLSGFDDASVYVFISLQAIAVLVVTFILQFRILYLNRMILSRLRSLET
ncbi:MULTISPECIES: hypothetical protein [Pseudomonas syringae group]|uniref:Polysaccharide biosynthesis protein n=1 Tax=Pseudomonas syringae pv. ribicola TaxID=55398 RepID=A0A3M2VSQ7_PSESI|nr:hypothetical protein [Pseudomonas syringae group genomosp. 3]RML42261.1 hypothetical protein ALQ95_200142 [Pseudomonas syringae pv. ribicola]